MEKQTKNLTQYIFGDDHEEIANDGGKLVAVRTGPEADYFPLKGGIEEKIRSRIYS